MEKQHIYGEPQPITEKEVFKAIDSDDVDRLLMIPIELGVHHDNWRFIQDSSVRLSDHPDPRVRANALLGIEYAARFKGRVEKNIVKPVLLRAREDEVKDVSDRAQETIEAINHLMGWSIGGANTHKKLEKRFEARRKSNGSEQADVGDRRSVGA